MGQNCFALGSAFALFLSSWVGAAERMLGPPVETLLIRRGNLSVLFRDNAQSPKVLSGIDSLFNVTAAPEFDAFDPLDAGASAGLNFEHIISGHRNASNAFA